MSRSSPKYKHTSRRGSAASNTYKGIEDLKQSLSELDNFLSITEDMILREKELDRDLYRREREIKSGGAKEEKVEPVSIVEEKIVPISNVEVNVAQTSEKTSLVLDTESKSSTPSPKLLHKLSRLRFEGGKVVCIDEESPKSNVAVTHKIVKEIISNETRLVNLEKLFDITDELGSIPETNNIGGICSSSRDSDEESLKSIEHGQEVSDVGEILFVAHDSGDDGGKYRSFDENLLRSPKSGSAGSDRQNFSSLPIVPAEIDEELVKKFIAAKNGINVKKSSPM